MSIKDFFLYRYIKGILSIKGTLTGVPCLILNIKLMLINIKLNKSLMPKEDEGLLL